MGQSITAERQTGAGAAFAILCAISFSHLLNDLLQSLLPAVYPVLKTRFGLSFGQVGAITLVNTLTASALQPVIGHVTDRRPMPFSLPLGMGSTLLGILLVSTANSYAALLFAVALVGVGSSVFHPESSRVARLAARGRPGFAQALFQVGGNAGAALGPLAAAFVVAADGQASIGWFALLALLAILVLAGVSLWYRQYAHPVAHHETAPHSRRHIGLAMTILVMLMLSKFFYLASMSNYYTFYLISRFHVPVRTAELCLFVFLGSVAIGTIAGGRVGDAIGRKRVILGSILGVLPFTLLLPHVGFAATVALTIPIGLLLASAFPAIVVYAQDLLPGRIGTVSGLMFGVAFGAGGIGAALLGQLADATSVRTVYVVCSFLPALGLLGFALPGFRK